MTAVIVTGVVNLQLAIVLSRRISIVNADPARSVRVEPSLFIAGASQLSVAVPVVVRPTATENCPVEALVVPSVTLMLMFSYTPTSAVLGVPYSHPVDLETAARYLYEVANHSNHPKAWRNLGMVYAELGWYDEALEIFRKVEDEASAYNSTGQIALANKDYSLAHAFFSEAVRQSPVYFAEAERNLAKVQSQRGR